MNVRPRAIADVLTIEPQVFGDARNFFLKALTRKPSLTPLA